MEKDKAKEFWARVSEILSERKVTFTSLMQAINRPLRTGIGWNVNNRMPPADAAQDIADVLGVSVRYLLTGEKEQVLSISDLEKSFIKEKEEQAQEILYREAYEIDFKNKEEYEKFIKFADLLGVKIEKIVKK